MTSAGMVLYTRSSDYERAFPTVPIAPGGESTIVMQDAPNTEFTITRADLQFTLGPGSPPISPTYTATSYPAGYNWWYVPAPFSCV